MYYIYNVHKQYYIYILWITAAMSLEMMLRKGNHPRIAIFRAGEP